MDTGAQEQQWLRCPGCGAKTRVKINSDTRIENFPLYCPKCRRITIVTIKEENKIIIIEPDAQTQSPRHTR